MIGGGDVLFDFFFVTFLVFPSFKGVVILLQFFLGIIVGAATSSAVVVIEF